MTKDNPLRKLETLGQSIWLDYIRRDLIVSGKLRGLIEQDGLRGMTSNPSIFEKAIASSHDYDEDIRILALEGKSAKAIYDVLSQRDVQSAADEFRPLYDKTDGKDGYVSLEVNPHLAHDTRGTIEEARRLWVALNRPNVFIKVPATAEGLPVIQQLISEGINVNVTLLFGIPRYRQVVEAYLAGIEARVTQAMPVNTVVSVASFFVSRIDALVDPLLEKLIIQGGENADVAKTLQGQIAIASAKIAYQLYKEIFGADRFRKLADKGAASQRLLWASTSWKNPEYNDVKYIVSLIGRDTVDTATLETLDDFRDHGIPKDRIEQGVVKAYWMLDRLPELGIGVDPVTQQLEDEGVEKFSISFDNLMETLENTAQKVKLGHERIIQTGVTRQCLSEGRQALIATARAMVAEDKGLLAMDESTPTCNKRFAKLGIPQTEEFHRAYRELIVTTPGLAEFISGVILYDETIRQSSKDGTPFMNIIAAAGIIPGIKVDTGATALAGHPGEKITEGLDGLRDRLREYFQMGARFAKWRAVITIGEGIPSRGGIEANAAALARYAALCQEAGLVPIVEPEVLMDGTHTLERCREVTEEVLRTVFHHLYTQRVMLEGMILKPNMVLPGLACPQQEAVNEVAEATVRCLLRAVPAAVPGIAFLSGGQSSELASARLNAMNKRCKSQLPWALAFSYGRAIQQPALDIWHGEQANVQAAQQALYHRARCNSAARRGEYHAAMEKTSS